MSKKGTKALASATLMSLVLTTALSAGPVKAAAGQVTRIGEADRYATAAKVATSNWTTSDNVVLVSGEGYADAVSASALAKKLNAPILLTTAGSLNADAKVALSTLKAKNIYVVGGNASVSASVRAELKANYTLVELQGANRYETNVAVAKQLVALGVDPSNVMMVGGEGFSDALSVAPIAAAKGQILLLGNNSADSMKSVIDFIKSNKSKVTVVGTSNVISDAILNAVSGTRIDGGASRFDTNLKVLAAFKDTVKADKVFVANASGNGYADALVASALAGKTASPLVLVDAEGTSATNNAIAYIKVNATKTTDLNVVGGTGVVTQSTVDAINNAVNPTVPVVPFAGEITSVEAVANQTVNAKSSTEQLKFTVNGGQTATADDVVKAGYKIQFITDQPVFEGKTTTSNDGSLDKTAMTDFYTIDNDHFKYQVQILKDDVLVAQSANTRVDLIKGDITANSITSQTIKLLDGGTATTKVTSGKLVKDEKAQVTEVKGNLVDGKTNVSLTINDPDSSVKFYSSDPFVATVDENTGVITANTKGTFTLTIKSGSQSRAVSMSVVDDARKVASVASNVSSMKLGKGYDASVDLTFKDQYGDVTEAVAELATSGGTASTTDSNQFKVGVVKNSDNDEIGVASSADSKANSDGKITLKVTNDGTHTGTGTLKVVNNDGATLLNISVTVDSSALVDTYKLEAAKDGKSSDLTLDLNPQAASDNDNEYVKINLNKYSSNGSSLGKDTTGEFDYYITENANNKIVAGTATDKKIPVTADGNGDIIIATPYANLDDSTITPSVTTVVPATGTVTHTGTVTLVAANKTTHVIKGTINITVKDTSPTISSVSFAQNLETTVGSDINLKDILKADDISVSGSAGDGKVRITQDGAIFINNSDKGATTGTNIESGDPDYNAESDILLGYIVATPDNSDISTVTISGGKVSFTMNGSKSSGTFTVGVKKAHDTTPFKTIKVKVDTN